MKHSNNPGNSMSHTTLRASRQMAIQYAKFTAPKVNEIISPLNAYLGIDNFCYLKIMKDNSFLDLTNNFTDFTEKYFLTIEKPSLDFCNYIKKCSTEKSSYLIWFVKKDSKDKLSILMDEYNIYNGFSIFSLSQDGTDIFSFSFNKSAGNKSDFFIKNTALLDSFTSYFKKKSYHLVSGLNKKDMPLFTEPFEIQSQEPKNYNKYLVFAKNNNRVIALSKQEYNCIKLLEQARSYKEIGKAMQISSRTVESYLESVKNKTGCICKSDMIANLACVDL